MIGRIPEQLIQHPIALHVEADIIFVGHADAAVHLHALLDGELRGAAGLGLGDRDHRLGVFAVLVEQLLRLERGRSGDLQLGIEMRGAELQGLELSDEASELFALPEIVDRHVHRRRAYADQLGRRAGAAGVEGAVENLGAAPNLADHRVGIDRHVVEGQPGADARIREPDALDVETPGILLDREQGQPLVGLRRHQRYIGRGPLNHELLAARQAEAVAGALGVHLDRLGTVLRPLVHGERGDRLPGEDSGIPALARRRALQRLDEGDRRREEGRRRQVAPDLLEHDPRLDMAEAEAAVRLADQYAGEAHLAELPPQAVAEAVLAALVAPVAKLLCDRAFGGHEVARAVAKHRLIVVEIERHISASPYDPGNVKPVRPERSRGTQPSAAEALDLAFARRGVSTSAFGRSLPSAPALQAVEGLDTNGVGIAVSTHPPGSSRIRFATIPSWISLVPPSIELALVLSHSRAPLPLRERSLSHSSASEPPAAIASSWRALLSSVPAYFIIEGWAGCAWPAFSSSMNRSDIARNAIWSTSKRATSARSTGSSASASESAAPSDSPWPPRPIPEIISRSWPSRYLATSQPLLTSPTTWSLGTFTSSKKVSQKGELPEMSRIGLVETPSLAISNRMKLIP